MKFWTLVATSADGTRELVVDFGSRSTVEGEPGALLHAAVLVWEDAPSPDGVPDWREQTIWEPNLTRVRKDTLVRRLTNFPDSRLTPQVVIG